MPPPSKPEPRGKLHLFLLILLAAAFAGFLLWMLNLRLSSGDTYPPYSSLRADPLGSRALHDALGALPAISTSRHTRQLRFLKPDAQTAVLFLGLNPRDLRFNSKQEREIITRWLDQGCHIVIALAATQMDYQERMEKRGIRPTSDTDPDDDEETSDSPPLTGLFGLSAKRKPATLKTPPPQSAQATLSGISLPTWRGSHILEFGPDSEWSTLATAEQHPTIASLSRGKGSIIVTTDSYPFSNEAQVHERHTPFLIALLSNRSNIVFEEAHLGVANEPGLVRLLRQYHLHGILAGGILLFIVLLWQGAGSLIPIDPAKDLGASSSGNTSGRDSSDGLVALLESGLPPRRLLDECIARHTAAHPNRHIPDQALAQARTIAAHTRTGKLAADYSTITTILSSPHHHHGHH